MQVVRAQRILFAVDETVSELMTLGARVAREATYPGSIATILGLQARAEAAQQNFTTAAADTE